MSAKMAFQTVIDDGSYTILLVPEGEKFEIDDRIVTFYPKRESEELRSGRPKRTTEICGSQAPLLETWTHLQSSQILSQVSVQQPSIWKGRAASKKREAIVVLVWGVVAIEDEKDVFQQYDRWILQLARLGLIG